MAQISIRKILECTDGKLLQGSEEDIVKGFSVNSNNIKNGEIFTKENGLEVLSLGLNIFTAGQAGKSLSKVGKSYAGNSAKKFSKVKESGNAQVPLKYDLQFFGSEWYIFLENR